MFEKSWDKICVIGTFWKSGNHYDMYVLQEHFGRVGINDMYHWNIVGALESTWVLLEHSGSFEAKHDVILEYYGSCVPFKNCGNIGTKLCTIGTLLKSCHQAIHY